MAMPMLGLAAILIATVIQAPWPTLTIICLTYIATIPFSIRHFRKIVREDKEEFDLTDLALGVSDLGDLDKKK